VTELGRGPSTGRGRFSSRWLLLALLFAAAAFSLVFSPDVREFYRARRAERGTL
jgi:hypothetical protein